MAGRTLAFVGSRTTRERNARGDGISVYAVEDGALRPLQVETGLINPSFLALNRAGDRLYTVHGDRREVSAFIVDADGSLHHLNTVTCEGRNPVHLALDRSERWLVVSNHLSGAVAVLEVGADGSLGRVVQTVELPGEPGPHRVEQPHAKPHFNLFDPSGRYVIVPDKGLDRIFSLHFDDGHLSFAESPWVECREGAGPRHVAFHPALPIVYCVNELDSTVTSYAFDSATGALKPLQLLTTLPSDFTGNSRGAEIEVDRAGRFVYVSNRGHDSIATFRVDAKNGTLAFVACTGTEGKTPRFFTLSPEGDRLYALNEDSDSIAVFALEDGIPKFTGRRTKCGSPVSMVFARK